MSKKQEQYQEFLTAVQDELKKQRLLSRRTLKSTEYNPQVDVGLNFVVRTQGRITFYTEALALTKARCQEFMISLNSFIQETYTFGEYLRDGYDGWDVEGLKSVIKDIRSAGREEISLIKKQTVDYNYKIAYFQGQIEFANSHLRIIAKEKNFPHFLMYGFNEAAVMFHDIKDKLLDSIFYTNEEEK